MAYEITLSDSNNTWTSPTPDTPLTETVIESSTEVTTLDLNVYVDLVDFKRSWKVTWGYMNSDDYAALKGFYMNQFTNLEFPTISIPDMNVENIVARVTLSDQSVSDQSGLVENVELTLRETVQSTGGYIS